MTRLAAGCWLLVQNPKFYLLRLAVEPEVSVSVSAPRRSLCLWSAVSPLWPDLAVGPERPDTPTMIRRVVFSPILDNVDCRIVVVVDFIFVSQQLTT